MKCNFKNQSGFSLLEVLLACTLSSLVLFGLMQLYLNAKFVFGMQAGLGEIHENTQMAFNLLNQRVHEAGYAGCEDLNRPVHVDSAIRGYRSNEVPDYLSVAAVAGTDVLVVSACDSLDGKNIYLEKAYYISDSNRKNSMNQPIFSLYEKIPDGNRQELVANIGSMKIFYGESNLSADQVQDWSSIRSVRIALLLNSQEAVLKKPENYTFNGEIIGADKRLRRELDLFINLREINP